jgi:hypothetical protein
VARITKNILALIFLAVLIELGIFSQTGGRRVIGMSRLPPGSRIEKSGIGMLGRAGDLT